MALAEYVRRWSEDPDGGDCFTGQRDLILAHDDACSSLRYAWLPRRRGVSCPSDLMECETCRITFFWEGITGLFDDCPESMWFFCRCCAEKALSCPCGGNCARQPDGLDLSTL
ncbi:MAG TPA: hypothetical protein VHA75_05330 [Rugosimonospora sp.]|nr:hypothetical protein [Rugosimonospora sp.]